MEPNEVVERLEILGLSEIEARVYAALLEQPRARVSELAESTGIHRPNLYPTLRHLADRGLVVGGLGKVDTYSAVAPEIAFRQAARALEHRLAHQRAILGELAARFAQRSDPTERDEPITVLPVSRRASMRQWLGSARRELCHWTARLIEDETPAARRRRAVLERRQLRRGLKVRALYAGELLADPTLRRRVEALVRAGGQARTADEIPFNLLIVDRSRAALALPRPSGDWVRYAVQDERLIDILRLAFDGLWQAGRPVEPAGLPGSNSDHSDQLIRP